MSRADDSREISRSGLVDERLAEIARQALLPYTVQFNEYLAQIARQALLPYTVQFNEYLAQIARQALLPYTVQFNEYLAQIARQALLSSREQLSATLVADATLLAVVSHAAQNVVEVGSKSPPQQQLTADQVSWLLFVVVYAVALTTYFNLFERGDEYLLSGNPFDSLSTACWLASVAEVVRRQALKEWRRRVGDDEGGGSRK